MFITLKKKYGEVNLPIDANSKNPGMANNHVEILEFEFLNITEQRHN